jgi:formylglycine-generating enzyme required for sulfatase activity
MKKLFPILVVLVLISSACQLGGGQAQPTPISVATAAPTNTPVPLNPTAGPSGNQAAGSTRTSSDGMTEVYIPAGTFTMGGLDPSAETDEKPAHKVTMPAYWIDKFDVTNAMYLQCVSAGACNPPLSFSSKTVTSYFNNKDYNDFPVVNVSWGEATTYCKWAGRHLPTEAEWEYAARGTDLRTYPWGDEPPDSTRANFNYIVGDTTKVGSFPAGASPFGVLDMAGNVAQWINDFYDATYYSKSVTLNPSGPIARTNYFNRVIRGGTFQDVAGDIRLANRASMLGPNPNAQQSSPAYTGDYSPKVGFRCVSDN